MLHLPRRALALLAVAALAACSGGDESTVRDRTGGSGPSDRVVATPRPTSTTSTTAGFVAGAGRPAAPPCAAIPASAQPASDRPSYLMDLDVRPEESVVEGRLTVRFVPDLDTDRLVFRLPPNGEGGGGARLEAGPVFLGSNAPAPVERPDPTTLVVPLPGALEAGRPIEATVPWTLRLPEGGDGPITSSDGAVRLASFFPVLAWEPGVGWPAEQAGGAPGTTWTPSVADFSYAVNVDDGADVLASGSFDDGRWVATAHRDLAVSVGRFTIVEGVAGAPHPVQVRVGVHGGLADDPDAHLDAVVRSLTDLGARYGPYPHGSFSLALLPGPREGAARPGHAVLGPGGGGRLASEAVAAQWFSGLVASERATGPGLDVGLATWAASRSDGVPVDPAADTAPGARLAGALAALGDPDLVDCGLRLYVARSSFGIARPADLVEALTGAFPGAEATLRRSGALP